MNLIPRSVERRLLATLARQKSILLLGPRDAAHLETFLAEYPRAREGVVVCRTPKPFKLGPKVTAVPWPELPALVERLG